MLTSLHHHTQAATDLGILCDGCTSLGRLHIQPDTFHTTPGCIGLTGGVHPQKLGIGSSLIDSQLSGCGIIALRQPITVGQTQHQLQPLGPGKTACGRKLTCQGCTFVGKGGTVVRFDFQVLIGCSHRRLGSHGRLLYLGCQCELNLDRGGSGIPKMLAACHDHFQTATDIHSLRNRCTILSRLNIQPDTGRIVPGAVWLTGGVEPQQLGILTTLVDRQCEIPAFIQAGQPIAIGHTQHHLQPLCFGK